MLARVLFSLCILAPSCSVQCWGPAMAEEHERVDASQLCAVKAAIRWRERAWTADECQRIAAALNATRSPSQTLAMAINESDLREGALNVARPGVYDIGLMGVRCVTVVGAHARADWRSVSVAMSTMETATPRDRCTNGAARGLYAHQLLDGPTNIRTAVAVLASHGGDLDRYNGCIETKRRRCTYSRRIAAIKAALGGVVMRVPWKRTREQVRRIVEATTKGKRS